MKKLILLAFGVVMFTGCDDRPPSKETTGDVDQACFSIKEVTVREDTCEYLFYECGYGAGLTHLPNCKYCQKREKENGRSSSFD